MMIFWLEFVVQPSSQGLGAVSLSSGDEFTITTILYAIGSLLVGFSSACLCIEFQRVFGTLGTQYVLYIGCLAVVLSCFILIPFLFLPQVVTYVLFLAIPIILALCHHLTVRSIAAKSYYTHGLTAKLIIPVKLLITATLHGLSIGVLMGYPLVADSATTLGLQSLLAFIGGVTLLFALSILVKLDYNHLLYQVGFPLVALGALCLVCLSAYPLLGTSLQLAGFCFIHMVMWGVCTYFIKNLSLPATWTKGISTCAFMFGQLVGALATMLLGNMADTPLPNQYFAAIIVFVVLLASLLMMSSTNLRTGWGLARLDTFESIEQETDTVIENLIIEFMLTERQTSVLLLLTRGRSRRVISEELYISEETVKTHIQQLYRKFNVHSRQELIDFYESRLKESVDRVRKPLFSSQEHD